MKTLLALQTEAQNQPDWQEKPRLFLAIFPSGQYNGHFLDPFLGAMLLKGIEGAVRWSAVRMGEAYGDLAPGQTITIAASGNGFSLERAVMGEIASSAVKGQRLAYRLRLVSENAPDTVLEGELQL